MQEILLMQMKDLIYFFRLSRPLNVLISLVAFWLACFIASGRELTFFTDPDFWMSSFCIIIISATGYWINDVFDLKIDRINKPEKVVVGNFLSKKKVVTVYIVAVVITLGLSLFKLSPILSLINFSAAFVLFVYAWYFKRVSVIGNLLIAAITCLVVYYGGVLYGFHLSLIWTMVFAFEITFLRELTKDIEDIKGDLSGHLNTLPIRIGIGASKKVLVATGLLFMLSCYLPVFDEYLRLHILNWKYLIVSLLLVQAPMGYLLYSLGAAKEPEDFAKPSAILKLVIITGILSVLFLS